MASVGVIAVVMLVGAVAVAQICAYWRVNPRLVVNSLMVTLAYFLFYGIGIGLVALAATVRREGVGLGVLIFLIAWFVFSVSLLIQYAPRPDRREIPRAGAAHLVSRVVSMLFALGALGWLIFPVFR